MRCQSRVSTWLVLLLLLILLSLAGLCLGSISISPMEIPSILLGTAENSDTLAKILIDFRLTRTLAALFSGAALAVSGLCMQTLFRNPLAGPSILGINAGANLGVALTVLAAGSGAGSAFLAGMGLAGRWTLAFAAVSGSFLVLFIILLASRKIASVTVLLLFGMLFGYAANAVVTLLIHASVAEKVHAYIIWTFGSFALAGWDQLTVMLPLLSLSLGAAFFMASPADIMLLGEEYAGTMGLRVRLVRSLFIVVTALLAGIVGAFCGPVTFIGVAVPHLARGMFSSSKHRDLMPASALCGALVALSADLIARLPGSSLTLPLNAVTSLFGAPVVIYILLRDRRKGVSFT